MPPSVMAHTVDRFSRSIVLQVRVSRRLRRRLWLGGWLLRLAAWVMTVGIRIEECDDGRA